MILTVALLEDMMTQGYYRQSVRSLKWLSFLQVLECTAVWKRVASI